MAQKRWLNPLRNHERRPTIYHLINRVVDRRFVLGEEEKEKFRMFMRMAENFSGCRVLSYCVMSNHFHLLLEVPPRVAAVGDCVLPYDWESVEEALPPRAVAAGAVRSEQVPGLVIEESEFFLRLRELYSEPVVENIRGEVAAARKRNHPEEVARIFARYAYRMHDLSEFMKTLTQRFSSWFNRAQDRKGRLWEQRFKSVIVEDGMAAKTMAAYIDLNPVRAGIVEDPADYRWSSYAEAVAGGRKARAGLARAVGTEKDSLSLVEYHLASLSRSWAQGGIGKRYRRILLGLGQEKVLAAKVVKKGMSKEKAEKELAALESRNSDFAISKVVRNRVRYFSDGLVIGGKDFVEDVFRGSRNRFGGNRKTGARIPSGNLEPMKQKLWTMRDLQKE